MDSPLVTLFAFGGIIDWVCLAVNFMALRSYAASQGLPPAHAWKLFGQIWRDQDHRMRPSLEGLIFCTVIFIGCVGGIFLFGQHTAPAALHPAPGQ